MESTRFYYADAAVEEYIRSIITEEERKNLFNVIESMNQTIKILMSLYLKSRKENRF
jgi:hypothetical protein